MSTTASLDSTTITLDPGGEAVVPLTIHNTGDVVEGYQITVVGPPASWAVVEPSQLSLYPGTSTTATVTFRPPRSARTPAGQQRFGVVVTPTEHPDEAVVPEGVVEVLPFLETTAELVPRTSQGRRGRHQVAIDNRGNVPVNVVLTALSDGERLRFKVAPVGLVVGPGEAQFAKVGVKARKRIWRGEPVTHPFVVHVNPQESVPVELDGSYVQTATIPKWLVWAMVAALALLGVLAALWFWLLKPTIESQAKEAAAEEAAVAEQAAEEAKEAAQTADKNADAANKAATDTEKTKDEIEKEFGEPKPPRVLISNASERLEVETAGTDSDPFAVPEDGTFRMTDVVFSNPQGDFGRAVLLVDGTERFDVALENFRDLDFHFVSPIVASDEVVLEVQCREPGTPPGGSPAATCDVAAYVGGELSVPAEEE